MPVLYSKISFVVHMTIKNAEIDARHLKSRKWYISVRTNFEDVDSGLETDNNT